MKNIHKIIFAALSVIVMALVAVIFMVLSTQESLERDVARISSEYATLEAASVELYEENDELKAQVAELQVQNEALQNAAAINADVDLDALLDSVLETEEG